MSTPPLVVERIVEGVLSMETVRFILVDARFPWISAEQFLVNLRRILSERKKECAVLLLRSHEVVPPRPLTALLNLE